MRSLLFLAGPTNQTSLKVVSLLSTFAVLSFPVSWSLADQPMRGRKARKLHRVSAPTRNPAPAEQFAPVVKFDREAWHVPMSAERWFDRMLCGEGGPPFRDGQYHYDQCAWWDSESHDYRFPNDRRVWSNPPPYGGSADYPWVPAAEALVDVEDSEDPGVHPDWWWGTNGPQGGPHVPTYVKVAENEQTGALRIKYWWYYGYQAPCEWSMNYGIASDKNGEHIGDWEHVMVTTSPDQSSIEAVTYFQHGGRYTRWKTQDDGFETELGGHTTAAQRPVVYIGRFSHGSYHDSQQRTFPPIFALACLYFNDRRDPSGEQDWWFTDAKLVDLRLGEESWMDAESAPLPPGATERWKWGPSVNSCSLYFLRTCWKHNLQGAVGTHPTLVPAVVDGREDWCFTSCKDDGCEVDQWESISDHQRANWMAWCGNGGEQSDRAASETNGEADAYLTCSESDLQIFQANHEDVIEAATRAVAWSLGMTSQELKSVVANGQAPCGIARSLGADLAETWTNTHAARRIALEQARDEGLLTQSQADRIMELLAEPPECQDTGS